MLERPSPSGARGRVGAGAIANAGVTVGAGADVGGASGASGAPLVERSSEATSGAHPFCASRR